MNEENNPVTETKKVGRLDDIEFFDINEQVATGDNPTIGEIARRTGLQPSSVTQRRLSFNKTYGELDPPTVLTKLPRGSRKIPVKEMHAQILATIATRKAEAEAKEENVEA